MMTYRMMAEVATDLACKKLGVDKKCETATTPLPGSEEPLPEHTTSKNAQTVSLYAAEGRHGTMTKDVPTGNSIDGLRV